jgi:hypothetical protein
MSQALPSRVVAKSSELPSSDGADASRRASLTAPWDADREWCWLCHHGQLPGPGPCAEANRSRSRYNRRTRFAGHVCRQNPHSSVPPSTSKYRSTGPAPRPDHVTWRHSDALMLTRRIQSICTSCWPGGKTERLQNTAPCGIQPVFREEYRAGCAPASSDWNTFLVYVR